MQLSPFENVQPVNLSWTSSGDVQIVWDDAHQSTYTAAYLREKCPCATCQGTHGPPTTLVVRTSRAGLPILQGNGNRPPSSDVKSVLPVGKYAIRFTWADGHNGGIYSWRYLRSICPSLEDNRPEGAN